jgi:hypothetical protein
MTNIFGGVFGFTHGADRQCIDHILLLFTNHIIE